MPYSTLWAVYELADGSGPVVWPLNLCAGGDYHPVLTPDTPNVDPLPLSVHPTRAGANRALARSLYACAGCA